MHFAMTRAGWIGMILLVFTGTAARARTDSGVTLEWTAPQVPAAEQSLLARIEMTIPDNLQVYADKDHFFRLEAVETTGLRNTSIEISDPVMASEAGPVDTGDGPIAVYEGDAVFEIEAEPEGADGDPWELIVELRFQTCTPTMCFPPETHRRRWSGTLGGDEAKVTRAAEDEPADSAALPKQEDELTIPADFQPVARASGYMGKRKFMQFLAEGKGERNGGGGLTDALQNGSIWLGLLLILVAGVALNLTPCVLPMIPVNLAIIGAGAQAATRRRGFLMGGIYGLSIAATYGVLGLLVVLGGGTFGAINASPAFNFIIAGLFLVLAAAMLGTFSIDFSRFSSGVNINRWKGTPPLLAAVMGSVTAVLAGACVAPVVIAVILVATRQYAAGNSWALVYPFVLGLGMGLPWPIAGAGLSFLPKPGTWMKMVKVVFGIFFIGLGVYYGVLGYSLLGATGGDAQVDDRKPEFWMHSLKPAFKTARETGKPVLLDFATPWCKSCHAMDRTTLADPQVQEELQDFVPVAYEVKDPNAPGMADFLENLGVIGFPTYIVLSQDDDQQP